MSDLFKDLHDIVVSRQEEKEEGSYTVYLFEKGLNKILKKVAEESGETLIAAKTLEAARISGVGYEEAKEELVGELGDLIYHLTVLMVESGVTSEEVDELLRSRMQKKGNLKEMKVVDKNT
ncbi:MAG: phosphoribosyl-ATP diphosphatase [Clostridiales Family XIII bacterium]|jgi:phosphoribosyl-ATP pyrophosphohydrolase|nr:phosphoribosyl-ATP diphosphatase [Clostridiales Family XIII bacterium]